MAGIEEIRTERLKKLSLLKAAGRDPYPNKIPRDHSLHYVREYFAELTEAKQDIALSGRVMAVRGQGAIQFVVLNDGTEKFQVVFKKDVIGDDEMAFFGSVIDVGDFISVTGELFTTQRGEESIMAKMWVMGAKSLLPLPEKWHGLEDEDVKLRKRYLDIMLDPELRDLFVKKSKFWNSIRSFMIAEGFLEVETPLLENTTGGADARPFKTHHNALDIDVFLRISCGELWQKRLMVAGYNKVFEIGRIFRNEGISPEHAQDYTQLEFYWGYANYEDGMELVERMYKQVAQETFGTLQFTIGNFEVDLAKKWEHYDYRATIKEFTDTDIESATLSDIEEALRHLKVEYDKKGWNRIRAIDTLWKYCRKKIAGPGFLINMPVEMSPLAKLSKDGKTVEQFQPIIAGSELGKGYSELNDPIDQARRFQAQQNMRDAGDDEAQMFDHEFVEALEHGMPPTCGFGLSERVFSFLANKPIREAQLFPLMRPK
ncbi:MAG: lysyl-tRNA synthetase [Parcubacteria group bacterium GW2011_GWA2_47_7]|nr:MAG: lysyl-tRNA synthetase [Parcubacteria group bacterium GW2011_GWA2_47_7]